MEHISLLSVEQAAQFLGVSKQTLAVWRCEKRYPLPYVKVGARVRYRIADLETFVASRTVSAAA